MRASPRRLPPSPARIFSARVRGWCGGGYATSVDTRCRPHLSLYRRSGRACARASRQQRAAVAARPSHPSGIAPGRRARGACWTGTGYYTAILAHLVGPSGRVTGIEYDASLAARARANLASYANVAVIEGDGTQVPFDAADVIYVNAGCTRPATRWLDGLADGGRLIMPMTSDQGFGGVAPERMASAGAVFRIERRGADYLAQWISPVAIFPCAGSRDEASERALAEAFTRGGWQKVTRLYRDQDVPDERCWLRGPGWCLAYN